MGVRYKDPETGEWIDAGSIRGPAGKSPYDYARDGGYSGTEAEFMRMLNNGLTTTDEIYFQITPEGVISLKPEYRGAFAGSTVAYISDNGKGRAGTRNKELPEEIVIPESVGDVEVTTLSDAMFFGNKRIKRIVLPSSVEAIPEAFCNGAWNLEEVLNTENIKSLGSHAFANSGLRKAYFPNLVELPVRSNGNQPSSHFSACANLVVADLGSVFAKSGAAIPTTCFNGCERLVSLRNAGGVTSIGAYGLHWTKRIENLPFLPNLTAIGSYGLLHTRVDYDWGKFTGSAFGESCTPNSINATDYSGCSYTPCNTPMNSTFEQHNPLWADKYIIDYTTPEGHRIAKTYSLGCKTVSAAMVYSALTNVAMDSPEEFVAIVGKANPDLLKIDIADGWVGTDINVTPDNEFVDLRQWLDAVGLHGEYYPSVSISNVKAMYSALANGAMVIARVPGSVGSEYSHIVVIHGINNNGELLIADPSSAGRDIGVYEAANYAMPIQNLMRYETGAQDDFLVVTRKTTV